MTAVLEALDLGTRESANPFVQELVAEDEVLEAPADQHRFVGQVDESVPRLFHDRVRAITFLERNVLHETMYGDAMRPAIVRLQVTGGHCLGHWPACHTIPYGAQRKGVGPPDEQGADPGSAGQRD